MDLLPLTIAIVVVLIVAALLVNLAAVNILRQAAFYREHPEGDYDAYRRRQARANRNRKP